MSRSKQEKAEIKNNMLETSLSAWVKKMNFRCARRLTKWNSRWAWHWYTELENFDSSRDEIRNIDAKEEHHMMRCDHWTCSHLITFKKQLIIACRCWLICGFTPDTFSASREMKWNGNNWRQTRALLHGVVISEQRQNNEKEERKKMRKREINVYDEEWSEN